ncbi:MAG: ankyrin repeat domain-containing protein [Fimbriimonadales bacterium]
MSDRSDSETQFFNAVFSGELEKTAEMLADEPGLIHAFWAENFNASAMNAAAMSGKTEMVDLLIELGASVDDGSDWWAGSFSPLITAINRKDANMTAHLIARGATVTAYEAAAMGDIVRLQAILDEDPGSVNMRGGDGQTPLHLAANREIASLLLKRGADIEAKDVDHESTPLQYAIDRPDVAQFLLEQGAQGDLFVLASISDTKYLRDAIDANSQAVHTRLEPQLFPTSSGIEVIYAFTIGYGCTPLHAAARANQTSAIELLVASGANINERGGYDDSTPTHIAAWQNCADAIRTLARSGAGIDIRSGSIHNTPPIVWAIVGGSADAVRALIEAGAKATTRHLDEAEAGVRGEFDRVRRVDAEVRKQILRIISAAL